MGAIRVGIADDHPIALSGLDALLRSEGDFCVCGSARNLEGIDHLLASAGPEVLVSDLILGRQEAGENLVRWRREFPATRFVILSMIADLAIVRGLLEKGASGYVCKSDDPEELLLAIRAVARRENYLGKTIRDLIGTNKPSLDVSPLTERERQVFRLVGEGLSNKEIGKALFLSTKTIETHKEHIKNKLNFQLMSDLQGEAKKWCIENGLTLS